jgi:hypothetical protein
MKNKANRHAEEFGLLANGSAGSWDIAVDESLERKTWTMEIDGPQVYLTFQLRNLNVLSEAFHFLQMDSARGRQEHQGADTSLVLGNFGGASVSLVWDNEDVPRCFIIIGPKGRSTLRVSLDAADIQHWIKAVRQILKDISQVVAK